MASWLTCPESKKVVGVDINENEVLKLKKLGYNVVYADVQDPNLSKLLKEKFDVIVASEIIEHLSNPGLFLDNIKLCLKKNGTLVLTTPNAQYIKHYLSSWSHSIDHVVTFTLQLLLQLLQRHNYLILEKQFLRWGPTKSIKAKLYINPLTLKISSRIFCDTLGVVAKPKERALSLLCTHN